MRRNQSLLALAFLAASAFAPSALANSVNFASSPLCKELPESGQVQCSGTVSGVDRGLGPTQVQVTVPYHCETGGLHRPPDLATGQGAMTEEGDIIRFQVTTQPIDCVTAEPPQMGSRVSLRVLQGDHVLLEQNLPVHISPPPQQ